MQFLKEQEFEDGVRFVILDNPSDRVNTLTSRMFSELEGILDTVESDGSTSALVFMSAKEDNFIVGADIREFENITNIEQSSQLIGRLHSIFNRIAALPFPVIAAIHGPCMGGGLEFALACHFRIATDWPKTILALPEVRLGLFPAAGGTQRLPRLIGVRKALPLMLTGQAVDARRAKALGLVDLVAFPGDFTNSVLRSIPLLKKRFSAKTRERSTLSLDRLLGTVSAARKAFFRSVRRRIQKQTGGNYPAPFRLVDCVEAGLAGSLADGLRCEAEGFGPLVVSAESKAMRSLFFMQNSLKKKQFGSPAPVQNIGILGSGLMGSGIAIVSAAKGYRVTIKDIARENLTKALGGIWKHFDSQARKKRTNPVQRDKHYSLVTPALDYRALARADLVIEAVFEDIDLKHRVIKEVEEHIGPKCIFASNTSAIPISRIAEASKRPENVIGMHYFSPVPKMPLLEIIVTEHCADWVLATAVAVGRRQGKTVIVVKDGPGFYTTRVLMPFMIEAIRLIQEGAKIRKVDDAIRDFGFPVGPFKLMDEVGIDVSAHIAHGLGEFFSERGIAAPPVLDSFLTSGFSGRKSGIGFYDYSPGYLGKLKVPGFNPPRPENSGIYKLVGSGGRDKIDPSEMQKRLVYLMVNEAALCLQEGIISGPEEGDIGAVFGIGFPPFRGGPFRYLDAAGISRVVSDMESYAARLGPRFEPAPILVHMAEHEDKFYK